MTNEELDALVQELLGKQVCTGFEQTEPYTIDCVYGPDPVCQHAATAITTLRAQLAEVQAGELAWAETAKIHLKAEQAFLSWLRDAGEHLRTEGVTICDDGTDNGEVLAAKVAECVGLLKARADRAEAALAAPEVMHEDAPAAIVGEIGNQIHNLGCELQNDEDVSLRLSELACRCWDVAKLFPTDRTALDRMLAEAREKALRMAADELRGQGYGAAVRAILALIEKPQCV